MDWAMKRDSIIAWLRRRAIQAAPYEACGFILNDGEIVEVANGAENPLEEWQMTAEDLSKRLTAEQFSQIIAVWHTHPRGSKAPSPKDIQAMIVGAIKQDWMYLIATQDGVTQWNPKNYAPQGDSFWNEFIA